MSGKTAQAGMGTKSIGLSGKVDVQGLDKSLLDPGPSQEKQGKGVVYFLVMVIGSIMSSVLIVLCNKEVFEHGAPFPLTMSFIAYVFTWLYYVILNSMGVFKKEGKVPLMENVKVALSSIGSISFMNLCLLTNTVAIYQICKFATIPATLLIQWSGIMKGGELKTNWKVLASLTLILGGVGWSSGMSFETGEMKVIGIIYAVLAVITTSTYRIFQETKQKEYKAEPTDFQACMAAPQAFLGLFAAIGTEFFAVEKDYTVMDYIAQVQYGAMAGKFGVTMLWLLGVCFFALTVNFTSFGLIGQAGPVAYAVVGHAKTVLTIIMGIVLFPKEETAASVWGDIVGCGIAMFGVIAYGHFEFCLKKNKPDILSCGKAASARENAVAVSP